jgi:hypothetical protein
MYTVADTAAGAEHRLTLVGMIGDSEVLGRIATSWERDGLFNSESRAANRIGSWCCRHYKKHGRAPGEDIRNIFLTWAEEHEGQPFVNEVDKLLSYLLQELEQQKQ